MHGDLPKRQPIQTGHLSVFVQLEMKKQTHKMHTSSLGFRSDASGCNFSILINSSSSKFVCEFGYQPVTQV